MRYKSHTYKNIVLRYKVATGRYKVTLQDIMLQLSYRKFELLLLKVH